MTSELIKIEKSMDDCCGTLVTQSHYPWGTSLTFENGMVDKLGIGALQPGDVVEICGYAVVESIHQSASKDDSNKSVGLQLTDIKVTRRTGDDYIKQLYGDQS